jgi:hypothetical protein
MNPERNKPFEILAVLLTGLLKFIFIDWFNLRVFYIGITCLFWIGYVYKRYQSDNTILKSWGFQLKNFRSSFFFLLPFFVLSCTGIILYGLYNHTDILNWHVIPVLLLYPVWGLFQQFIMVGLIAGNLKELRNIKFKNYQIILLTSFLFSLVHYPSVFLMIFTFFMELVFIFTYLKWRNLWSLGLYHGVIATFLLFYVLERDLWLELWPGY